MTQNLVGEAVVVGPEHDDGWTKVGRTKKTRKKREKEKEKEKHDIYVIRRSPTLAPSSTNAKPPPVKILNWRIAHEVETTKTPVKPKPRSKPLPKSSSRSQTSLSSPMSLITTNAMTATSASPSNKGQKLKSQMWNLLFRNVSRAVDELYYMCETESDADQCYEAQRALMASVSEFESLRERIDEQSRISHGSSAVAWEVRSASLQHTSPLLPLRKGLLYTRSKRFRVPRSSSWGDEMMDIDDAAAEREKKSPKAHRSLHEKLSSPDRKKPSPTETRRRQDEKQTKAQLNRAKVETFSACEV